MTEPTRPRDAAASDVESVAPLIERAGQGDAQAFARVYDALAPMVFETCARVLRNRALAEETAQDVFIELWRISSRYDRSRGTPQAWAVTVAHRRSIDRVRSERAARAREDRDGQRAPTPVDSVEDTVDLTLRSDRVAEALAVLNEGQREAIELAYYGGHSYREVATMLGVPEGTVKARIRNGLQKLRRPLEAER